MTFELTLADLFAFIAASWAAVLTALLLWSGKPKVGWLASFTGMFAVAMLASAVRLQLDSELGRAFVDWLRFLNFAAMPCLFLYASFAFGRPAGRATIAHFAPAGLAAVALPFLSPPLLDLIWYLAVGQIVLYLGIIIWSTRRYRMRLKQNYSNLADIDLTWLETLSWLLLVLVIADVVAFPALALVGVEHEGVRTVFNFLGTLYILWLTKGALRQYFVPSETEKRPAYDKSGLDDESADALARELTAAVAAQKLFENPDLTLRDLAAAAGLTPHVTSEVLNRSIGESFYGFINRRRVESAKNRLLESNDTILEIAFAVGFNNKASFNKAFKKFVGGTPSQFRQRAAEKQ